MNGAGVVVEILGSHGQVRTWQRVQPDAMSRFTIGRSVEADVVLDDPHVAALHAQVVISTDGLVRVTDLDTINGVIVDGERHHGLRELAAPAGELRIGRTMLRIRAPGQALAPERPDHTSARASSAAAWVTVLCALLTAAYVVYVNWVGAPRDLVSNSVTSLLATVSVIGAWITLWALLSRILLGEWRWLLHAAIVFGAAAAFIVIGIVLDLAWFSFTLPSWDSRRQVFTAAVFIFMLYRHLKLATHIMRLRTACIVILVPAVLVGAGLWVQWRAQTRNVNHIGMGEQFFPPALRLRSAGDAETFFHDLRALKDEADRLRDAVDTDDDEDTPL